MPSDFDPHHYFLGISPKQRPLNHYLLLGLESFESDSQTIETAADRQMEHLKRYESGEHGEQVAALMSEVSRARLCLANASKKEAYDQQLRAQVATANAAPKPGPPGNRAKLPPPLPRKPADANASSEPILAELVSFARSSPARPKRAVIDAELIPSTPAPPIESAGKAPSRETITNCIGMTLVLVPAGEFVMGSPINEPERGNNEFMHPVTIENPFFLGVRPVTQAQFRQVMDLNPSSFSSTGFAQTQVIGMDTSNFPVESVSWVEADEFCRRLSDFWEERAAGRRYRLPTEAEWEYACRAVTPTAFAFGNSFTSRQANFNGAMPYGTSLRGPNLGRPSIVGSYAPNMWGLYDMHGNVWEWCGDFYCPRHDRRPANATNRVIRGGSWKTGARACRSASRIGEPPEQRTAQIGFRVALEV